MPNPPTVVLDTNVLVAAGFKPASSSGRLLHEIRRGAVRLVWNDETLRETEHIIRKIPPLSWRAVQELFRPEDRFTGPTDPEAFSVVADPDDRKFAALAAAAGATLVTMDEHLLGVRDRVPARVRTPGEVVRELGGE
ncbi:MAG TPA: PIN domain-containing protein [Longimicrobiales bacterium]|nr:PIN domain-containing protein [Longimicrobiales bacterium]